VFYFYFFVLVFPPFVYESTKGVDWRKTMQVGGL